jgi:hypothetical protein
MPTLIAQRVRIALDVSRDDDFVDVATASSPHIWEGADVRFELGLHYGDVLMDVGALASVTLFVAPLAQRDGTRVMEKTVSTLDNLLAPSTWENGTAQHVIIPFTNAETDGLVASGDSTAYFIAIYAMTSESTPKRILLGTSVLTIEEAGFSGDPTPPDGETYLTAEQAAALLSARVGFRSGFIALTGGTSDSLDFFVTVGVVAGYMVPVVIDDRLSLYVLEAGTDAELVPWVVRPDDYAATTNEKVWRLCDLKTGIVYLYNGDQSKFHPFQVKGAAGAEQPDIGAGI